MSSFKDLLTLMAAASDEFDSKFQNQTDQIKQNATELESVNEIVEQLSIQVDELADQNASLAKKVSDLTREMHDRDQSIAIDELNQRVNQLSQQAQNHPVAECGPPPIQN